MDKIESVLTKIVANIIPGKAELEKVLRSGKKLNVYFGIEPTFTRIHLGNAVPLRKLQEFVELGHKVTFLIGDFTALIGDTSDKESERPVLTYEQIENNFQTYKMQASKIVDFSKIKVHHNSEWLKKLNFAGIIKLTRQFSLNDFISRELIKKRLNEGKSISLPEVLYPAMQGYDSYFMDTDIQIGGTDQVFNMQAGRTLQKRLRGKESFVVETSFPLEGTDGRKMSKSWGNAIWLDDAPDEIFGKVMSLKDELIPKYFEMATNVDTNQIMAIKDQLVKGKNPIDLKKELAFTIVSELHSKADAKTAKEKFEKTFQKGEFAKEAKTIKGLATLAETLASLPSVGSMSQAKRLLAQGAVDVSGETVKDGNYRPRSGEEVKVGKKTFIKIK
ncbi:MAG: tyrosine--tRNA ligase [Patescibacteria group bacterium]